MTEMKSPTTITVAPLTGSVDRNKTRYKETLEELKGRSPHGERG